MRVNINDNHFPQMSKIFKGKDVSSRFCELVLKRNSAHNSIYSVLVILLVKTQTISLHAENSNDLYFLKVWMLDPTVPFKWKVITYKVSLF